MSASQDYKKIAEALLKSAAILNKNMSENPEEFTGDLGKCVRDFCDAAKAAAEHFSKGKQPASYLLNTLTVFETIVQFYILFQPALKYVTAAMEVDIKEHRKKIEAINKGLAQVESTNSDIAEQIKNLSKILREKLIHGEDSKKEAYRKEFDYECDVTLNSLMGCIAKMLIIKRQIDDGLASTDVFRKRLANTAVVGVGIVAAIGIIAKLLGVCVTVAVGIGVLAAVLFGVPVYYCVFNPTAAQQRAQNKLQDDYTQLKYKWETLYVELDTMKGQLYATLKSRNSV